MVGLRGLLSQSGVWADADLGGVMVGQLRCRTDVASHWLLYYIITCWVL